MFSASTSWFDAINKSVNTYTMIYTKSKSFKEIIRMSIEECSCMIRKGDFSYIAPILSHKNINSVTLSACATLAFPSDGEKTYTIDIPNSSNDTDFHKILINSAIEAILHENYILIKVIETLNSLVEDFETEVNTYYSICLNTKDELSTKSKALEDLYAYSMIIQKESETQYNTDANAPGITYEEQIALAEKHSLMISEYNNKLEAAKEQFMEVQERHSLMCTKFAIVSTQLKTTFDGFRRVTDRKKKNKDNYKFLKNELIVYQAPHGPPSVGHVLTTKEVSTKSSVVNFIDTKSSIYCISSDAKSPAGTSSTVSAGCPARTSSTVSAGCPVGYSQVVSAGPAMSGPAMSGPAMSGPARAGPIVSPGLALSDCPRDTTGLVIADAAKPAGKIIVPDESVDISSLDFNECFKILRGIIVNISDINAWWRPFQGAMQMISSDLFYINAKNTYRERLIAQVSEKGSFATIDDKKKIQELERHIEMKKNSIMAKYDIDIMYSVSNCDDTHEISKVFISHLKEVLMKKMNLPFQY